MTASLSTLRYAHREAAAGLTNCRLTDKITPRQIKDYLWHPRGRHKPKHPKAGGSETDAGLPFKKEVYKRVHLMYNEGDKSDHSQILVISAVLFPIIDLRCHL